MPAPTSPTGSPSAVPTTTTTPAVIPSVDQGQTNGFTTINQIAATVEVLCRACVGGYAILSGLTFTTAGLVATMSTGVALIDALVLKNATSTVTLADNTTNYVYLSHTGALTAQTSSTAPTGKYLYVGKFVTSGGTVTTSTQNGVIYAKGGMLWRTTTDAGTPTDTLDSTVRVWTDCPGGKFIWDGSAHVKLS